MSRYKKILINIIGDGASLDINEFDEKIVESFNNFLSEGKEYCLDTIDKFHQQDIGCLSGWKIWETHKFNIEAENIDLMLYLVWVAFEKQMEVTDCHPWDGQFAVEEEGESLRLWLKGYFRFIARTGNYQGFQTSGQNYKNNNQYLLDIKDFLTTDEFEAEVLNVCNAISNIFDKNSLNGKDINLIKNIVRSKNSIKEISKTICLVCSINESEWAIFDIGIAMNDSELEFYDS